MQVRRGCGGGGGASGRGSLWRLQTSERLARLGAACGAAAAAPRLAAGLRLQLRHAAQRLEAEARALASPAPHTHHLADAVDTALNELANIVNRYQYLPPPTTYTYFHDLLELLLLKKQRKPALI